jgi:hypothetical protein
VTVRALFRTLTLVHQLRNSHRQGPDHRQTKQPEGLLRGWASGETKSHIPQYQTGLNNYVQSNTMKMIIQASLTSVTSLDFKAQGTAQPRTEARANAPDQLKRRELFERN